jgi:hypothetical protein
MKPYKFVLSDKDARRLDRVYLQGGYQIINKTLREAIQNYPLTIKKSLDIDISLALNKQSQTQDDWIQYFNSTNEQDFATFSDFLTQESLNNKEFIKNAREIMKPGWILTPIRITYNPTNLEATITDHYNSNKRTPRTTTLELPVYGGYNDDDSKLSNVLTTKKGLSLFQFLLNSPQASQTELSDKLESFSTQLPKNSYIWTPNQSSRASLPVRVLRLDFYGDDFHVNCDDYPSDSCPAFGVSVNPRSGQKK